MIEIDPANVEYDVNDECSVGTMAFKDTSINTTISRWDGEPDAKAVALFLDICKTVEPLMASIYNEIREEYHDIEFMPFYEYCLFAEAHDESGESEDPVYEMLEPYKQAFPSLAKPEDVTVDMTLAALNPWSLTLGVRDDEPHMQVKFGFGKAQGDHYVLVELDMDKNITDLVIES